MRKKIKKKKEEKRKKKRKNNSCAKALYVQRYPMSHQLLRMQERYLSADELSNRAGTTRGVPNRILKKKEPVWVLGGPVYEISERSSLRRGKAGRCLKVKKKKKKKEKEVKRQGKEAKEEARGEKKESFGKNMRGINRFLCGNHVTSLRRLKRKWCRRWTRRDYEAWRKTRRWIMKMLCKMSSSSSVVPCFTKKKRSYLLCVRRSYSEHVRQWT